MVHAPVLIDKGVAVAKAHLIEEFHIAVFVPRQLSVAESLTIRRTLDSVRFQTCIERALRAIIRRNRSLRNVKVTLTR